MNNTSIPPTIIINKIYENQKFILRVPVIIATRIVCMSSVKPIDKGWDIIENTRVIITIMFMINRLIQRIVY